MIPSTFFFLFSQLGVGMLICLLFISPRVIGNSFFKFASLTAAILMGVVLGFDFIFPSPYRSSPTAVILLLLSAILTVLYHRVVDVRKFTVALWLLIAACATGLVSIVMDSLDFTALMSLSGWEHALLAIHHVAGTAVLGSVMLAMVFGHWYLVIPGLSITHLERLAKVLIASILLRTATILVSFAVIQLKLEVPFSRVLSEFMVEEALFFWPRILFGVVVPIVLAGMIWNTIQLKHTQAATGLLYLAVVAMLFGEFFSKFLLFTAKVAL